MDQAVQTLLDKQAIYELSCRYMRGLDRLDADSLLSVFWEDAYCEYGFMNGDAPTFIVFAISALRDHASNCLLYTSPSPRDLSTSRMPSSA